MTASTRTPVVPWMLLLGLALAAALLGCSSQDKAAADVRAEVADLGGELDVALDRDAEADVAPQGFERAGVTVADEDGVVSIRNGSLALSVELAAGTIRVEDAGGRASVVGAVSSARVVTGDEEALLSSDAAASTSWAARDFDDALGTGLSLVLRFAEVAPGQDLETVIDLRGDTTYFTISTVVHWAAPPAAETRILRMSPLAVDAHARGGFYLGDDPALHIVLDNGGDLLFDFEAHAYLVGKLPAMLHPPGSVSNWNVAIKDSASEAHIVAGFFSMTHGAGLVRLGYDPEVGDEDDGRKAFTYFEGFCEYLEGRRPMSAGDGAALRSELFYVDLGATTPHQGLEDYASRYAARIGKKVWTDIPSGWNSWGGGYGSGGLGTNIDAPLMLKNLDAAAEDLLPYGMKYFLLDDGWEDHEGDWNNHPERFPDEGGVNGMKVFADKVKAKGMIPGVWISPFGVEHDSALAAAHPEWMVELNPMFLSFVPRGEVAVLDLSNPEVLDYLEEVFSRITKDWGYRWIKMDFSYYAFAMTNMHDPDLSVTEAYRNALVRIREAIGPDVFFLTISGQGLCFDIADSNRLGLDNEPWWGGHFSSEPGYKVIYRTVARRWWMNHRIWVNHPDLVYYRPQFGLTLAEARAWTSVVALTGGIVKLGDTYTALHEHPEWRAYLEPILPIYPRTGRPLDVFEREYPELWSLEAERDGHEWRVVGLFNWGENRDILATATSSKYEEEAELTLSLDLERIGLDPTKRHLVFDAWEHDWSWTEAGRVEATLAPRTDRIYVVREEPVTPAVVFTSRHLLGGAVEVHDEIWAEEEGHLAFSVDTVAGDPIHVYVAPGGASFAVAAVDGLEHQIDERDGLIDLSFTPDAASSTIQLDFE
jgi:hypothetical protein